MAEALSKWQWCAVCCHLVPQELIRLARTTKSLREAVWSSAAFRAVCIYMIDHQTLDETRGEYPCLLNENRGECTRLAALPDGRVVSVSGGYSGSCRGYTLKVWDSTVRRCLHTLRGDDGTIFAVCGLPDGRIVSVSSCETVLVWDVSEGWAETLRGHTGWVNCVTALSENVVSGSCDKTLRVWAVARRRPGARVARCGRSCCLQTIDMDFIPLCLAVTPENRLISGDYGGVLTVWDSANGRLGRRLLTMKRDTGRGEDGVSSVAALPDGRVAAAYHDQRLVVWNVATGEHLKAVEGPICWSPRGNADVLQKGRTRCVAALPDGRIVSGTKDTLNVWDVVRGRSLPPPLQTLKGRDPWLKSNFAWQRQNYVECVVCLPDGRVVTASTDKKLTVYSPMPPVPPPLCPIRAGVISQIGTLISNIRRKLAGSEG